MYAIRRQRPTASPEQQKARDIGAEGVTTEKTGCRSLPRTPDLDGTDEERSKLRGVQSRDWISLRSGTPSMRDQTPPPPPPKDKEQRVARSPLSKQHPWAARRSIRRVGSFEEETEGTERLFEPLPLELDLSPLDLQFGALVVDVQDGSGDSWEGKLDLPSRPKLVHFATTPSRSRRDLEAPFEPDTEDQRHSVTPRRSVTPYRPAPVPPRPRTITPIRNIPRSHASAHTSPRRSTSSWTHEIRSSIYRDLTPVEPSPARRRTRPDPALFPGVIPWKASPRDVGMRRQEKEWRRLQMEDGDSQTGWKSYTRSRKGRSWSGRERAKVADWRPSAGSDVEAERVEDGWEVLR
ncbi:hypothetical protein NCC49_000029 [Naganishia albida]|nr:hypothetical protein NCC49_000029 [Naganishia albida]